MKEFLLRPALALAGGKEIADHWFYVRDGQVVRSGAGEPPPLPEGIPVLSPPFALEPLVDCHVHLSLGGSFDPSERKRVAGFDDEEALERVMNLLEEYRRAGICAVRDGGTPRGLAFKAAELADKNPGRYAKVFPSAGPLFKKGLYGGFLGRGAETVEEGFSLIEEGAKRGARQIKILASGLNSLEVPGETGKEQFTPGELSELTRFSRSLGLGTMIHVNGTLGAVLDSAPQSVEHAFWPKEGEIEKLSASESFWTPTFVAWSSLSGNPSLGPNQKKVVEITAKRHGEDISKGISHGAKLLPGSDAGTPGVSHVSGFFSEVSALVSLGADLNSLAGNAASLAARLSGFPGLREGGEAGFVLYDSWPEDISSPTAVCFGGELTLLK
ncbi:hypothetical protein EPN96_08410 [bacterium]|nr:MAG: hypothetical protein EPN96_08410 [bacterium]